MATVTPAYSWPVPTSSDLVKDGATAIEALGDAIDASMNTALGTKKAGMVLLNTTSFSGVASQAVSNVFSSTYDNYRIVVDLDSTSTSNEIWFRLRVSSTDTSTNYYRAGWYVANGGSSGAWYAGNPGSEVILVDGGTDLKSASLDVYCPNKNIRTNFSGYSRAPGQSNTFGAQQSDTTQFTSFNLITSAGTMTGRVLTYGYNQ